MPAMVAEDDGRRRCSVRVAVDRSAVVPLPTGVSRSIAALVGALQRAPGADVVVGSEYDLWRGTGVLRTRSGARALRLFAQGFLTEYVRLGPRLHRRAVDVYHAAAARAPVRRISIPLVLSLYDVAPFEVPLLQGTSRGRRLRATIRHGVERARWIVVPSESVRRELAAHLPEAAAKTVVIPLGVDRVFGMARRTPATVPTFVSVATLERRKNLSVLIQAFTVVAARHPRARLRLIGQPGPAHSQIRARLAQLGLEGSVSLEGYSTDADVARAYAQATAIVYPSLYEGFGLPILEAMASGAPVVTSDRGAMREVAGGAALLVDPCDPEAVASAMLRVIDDDALRSRLEGAGRERAARFTWERCAQGHTLLYRAAAGGAAPAVPPLAAIE
jgi:alpha-1,3-rhamnosyl/mannosyltransferase